MTSGLYQTIQVIHCRHAVPDDSMEITFLTAVKYKDFFCL